MKQTYLFYDLETSGLNTVFDQILTFACIRTDETFTEVDRNEIKVRLRPDVVPSPGALLVNRLPVNEPGRGVFEYEAALKIHKEVNTPGTVSLGYNTLGFDDEFLRFTFYRNLLDPYSHQYSRGCGRMDIFPMTALYSIFKPELLTWPKKEDGNPTLRLDQLSLENDLLRSGGRSHEAMADVESTLNLAVLLSGEQDIFKYVADFFDKQTDRDRMEAINTKISACGEKYVLGILVSPFMGSAANYLSPAICLGRSRVYSNQHLWLRLDRKDLGEFAGKAEESDWIVVRKRYGDVPFILPWLDRFFERIPAEEKRLARMNLELVEKDSGLLRNLADYHVSFAYPYIPDLDADAALYQEGFFTYREKEESLRFHRAGREEKRALADETASARLRTIAKRIIARNFSPDDIPDSLKLEKECGVSRMPYDETIKGFRDDMKRTLQDAAYELARYKNTDLDEEQSIIADQLKKYLDSAIRTK